MPGRKSRTSPVLILITVFLCVIFGAVFTQSSADPSPVSKDAMPDTFVAENTDDSAFTSDGSVTDNTDFADDSQAYDGSPEPTASPAPVQATPTPKPAHSPEAEQGVWTSSGSNWLFMVNGTPFTGWLTDIDGKRYYLNHEGIMHTGWLDLDGKRYFLNLDGIMQTGDVTIGKETYHFLDDGSLKDYVPETASEPEKPKKNKTAALTFDDGPSSFTDRLLDCLEANNAKATFFMVGQEIYNFPDAVKRMEALGCELGNHTYSHADLTTLDPEGITAEVAGTDEALLDLTGHGATVLRPPFGSVNENVRSTVGTPMILWSIDTLDWETLDVQQTVDTILEQVQDGSIILMHDIFETSVEAAEIVIPKLIEQGYDLVTVHELAKAHEIELQTGIAYGSMDESSN